MENDASLLPSYGPVTRPSPEPDQSTPTSILFLEVLFIVIIIIIIIIIIIPSVPMSSQSSLYIRSPHQNPVYISPLTHTCQMVHPSHSSRFYYTKNIWCWVQVMKLYETFHSPMFLVHLGPNIYLKTLFSDTSAYFPASL